MQAQAAVLTTSSGDFTMEDVDLRLPVRDEVLVRVAGVGLCHTDIVARNLLGRRDLLPAILGHEGAGIVEATGPEVKHLERGDHVVLSFDSCGHCPQCFTGKPSYCDEFGDRNLRGYRPDTPPPVTGVMSSWFGQSSFATHSLVREGNAVRVARDLPLELLGPLGCGFQTGAGAIMNGMDVGAGSRVAIFGAGGVGVAAVLAATIVGAERVVAVELHPARRELARELGATEAVDGASPDLLKELKAVSPGGFTHTIDTTGNPTVIEHAMSVLRPLGVCVMIGAITGPIVLDPLAFRGGQKLSYLFEGDSVPQIFIPQLIELWRQGRFPFERLLVQYPLTRLNEAERDTNEGTVVKALLRP